MSQMLSFLRFIAEHPHDESSRLVFADWLEEEGDWRAEFLRLDVHLAAISGEESTYAELRARWTELRAALTPSWRTILGRAPVEKCHLRLKFACPLKWEELTPTGVASERHCDSCSRSVYYCHSLDEARDHAQLGHCVVIDKEVHRFAGDLDGDEGEAVMGLIEFPDE